MDLIEKTNSIINTICKFEKLPTVIFQLVYYYIIGKTEQVPAQYQEQIYKLFLYRTYRYGVNFYNFQKVVKIMNRTAGASYSFYDLKEVIRGAVGAPYDDQYLFKLLDDFKSANYRLNGLKNLLSDRNYLYNSLPLKINIIKYINNVDDIQFIKLDNRKLNQKFKFLVYKNNKINGYDKLYFNKACQVVLSSVITPDTVLNTAIGSAEDIQQFLSVCYDAEPKNWADYGTTATEQMDTAQLAKWREQTSSFGEQEVFEAVEDLRNLYNRMFAQNWAEHPDYIQKSKDTASLGRSVVQKFQKRKLHPESSIHQRLDYVWSLMEQSDRFQSSNELWERETTLDDYLPEDLL